MYILKVSEYLPRRFSTHADALEAQSIVHAIDPSEETKVYEEQSLGGYIFDPFMVEHLRDIRNKGLNISGIKLVRHLTGQGLKESKDFFEAL